MLGYLSWNQTGVRGQRIFFTSSVMTVMHSTEMNQGLKEDFLRLDGLQLLCGQARYLMYYEYNIENQFYLHVMNFSTRGSSCKKFKNTFD